MDLRYTGCLLVRAREVKKVEDGSFVTETQQLRGAREPLFVGALHTGLDELNRQHGLTRPGAPEDAAAVVAGQPRKLHLR